MEAAAVAAEKITGEELARWRGAAAFSDLNSEERRQAWRRFKAAANERHLKIGVTGSPEFARLPYFMWVPQRCTQQHLASLFTECRVYRYEHFSHYAVAHLFLYGILKDFYSIWSDASAPGRRGDLYKVTTNHKEVVKARYAWPSYIKVHIEQRISGILPTRQWSIAGASVLRSASHATVSSAAV